MVMADVRTRQYRRDLRADPRSLGSMRRIAAAHLRLWGYGAMVERVVVCLTELLANVGKHTRSPACVLTLEDIGIGVRLTVSDASPTLPVVQEVDWFAESGRGMYLVSRTASRWGSSTTATGKDVWAEFHLADERGAG